MRRLTRWSARNRNQGNRRTGLRFPARTRSTRGGSRFIPSRPRLSPVRPSFVRSSRRRNPGYYRRNPDFEIIFIVNAKTGKKDIYVHVDKDPDDMAYEHARLRREILAELIGQNLIDAAEVGEVTIEQVDNIPGQQHSHEHGHEHSHDEPAHKHPPRGRPLPPAGPQAPPRKSISNRRRYY